MVWYYMDGLQDWLDFQLLPQVRSWDGLPCSPTGYHIFNEHLFCFFMETSEVCDMYRLCFPSSLVQYQLFLCGN